MQLGRSASAVLQSMFILLASIVNSSGIDSESFQESQDIFWIRNTVKHSTTDKINRFFRCNFSSDLEVEIAAITQTDEW